MSGAIFLDRDGVIIENRADYVKAWDEVVFVPGAFEAMRLLTQAGWPLIMVTNQSAVGRGIITAAFVDEVHGRMLAEIEAQGGKFAGVYFCPHHPEAGCDCRKPEPGMLRQAAQELAIDLTRSYMIGDALTDLEAAQAVGATGILVRTGRGEAQAALLAPEVAAQATIVSDLAAAADFILQQEKRTSP